MKMVVVSCNCGDWFEEINMPCGSNLPFGRLIVENDKVVPQILKSAPFPKGHEADSLKYYKQFLNNLLDPTFVQTAPKNIAISNIETMLSPEDDAEYWISWLWQVFPRGCSRYSEFDSQRFPEYFKILEEGTIRKQVKKRPLGKISSRVRSLKKK